MPMSWRRVAWFASFVTALALALWMRTLGYGSTATVGVAIVVWVVLPFVISQVCAAFVLGRAHQRMRQADVLVDKIADVIRGLPPEEKKAVAKRMIDESLK